MSFGSGMAAGMGAGIGAGMAIRIAAGRKQAVDEISAYLLTKEIVVHDRHGRVVDAEELVSDLCHIQPVNKQRMKIAAVLALLVGVLVAGIVTWLVMK